MIQFEVTDDGIILSVSAGVGDLRGKIGYEKLPTIKTLPKDERDHFAVLMEVCLSRLILELQSQSHMLSMGKLKALQPVVVAPPEKKLIVPGG